MRATVADPGDARQRVLADALNQLAMAVDLLAAHPPTSPDHRDARLIVRSNTRKVREMVAELIPE